MNPSWEFYRHMPVFLANGRRLGRTEEIGHAVDYVHVQQGLLLIHDWYVPTTAVASVGELGVQLNVRMSDLRRSGWNVPPEGYLSRQGATPGYEYTSLGDVPHYAERPAADERGA